MRPEETYAVERSLTRALEAFLADLVQSNRAARTCHVYAADLHEFAAFYRGSLQGITPDTLRVFFATWSHLKPATRARKQAALASFLAWAYSPDLIGANPM